MILVIDNYDSFVFNLVCYLNLLASDTMVIRNDKITLETIAELKPSHIVLSPGPGYPQQAGICIPLIQRFYQHIPILGVCLGHQAIAVAMGGQVCPAQEPMHGRASQVSHQQQGIFAGLTSPLSVARYHSLIVDEATLPAPLQVTAKSAAGEIMALAHREFPLYGVQFHPESILSAHGKQLIASFLDK